MTKLSIVNNSIGGKQREQGGSLTFSPDWMILPKTNNNTNLPAYFPFFFFYTKQFKCNSLIQVPSN